MRILRAKIGVGLDSRLFGVIDNAENAIGLIERAKQSGMCITARMSILVPPTFRKSKIADSIALIVIVECMGCHR